MGISNKKIISPSSSGLVSFFKKPLGMAALFATLTFGAPKIMKSISAQAQEPTATELTKKSANTDTLQNIKDFLGENAPWANGLGFALLVFFTGIAIAKRGQLTTSLAVESPEKSNKHLEELLEHLDDISLSEKKNLSEVIKDIEKKIKDMPEAEFSELFAHLNASLTVLKEAKNENAAAKVAVSKLNRNNASVLNELSLKMTRFHESLENITVSGITGTVLAFTTVFFSKDDSTKDFGFAMALTKMTLTYASYLILNLSKQKSEEKMISFNLSMEKSKELIQELAARFKDSRR
jgi:hypothetical protein